MNKKLKARTLTASGNGAAKKTIKGKKAQEDFAISSDVKKQLLGFLMIVIGMLTLIAIASYSERDQARIDNINFLEIFRKEAYSKVYVTYNWLGIAGAVISNLLVNNLFGYFSAIIPLIICITGIALLRKRGVMRSLEFGAYSMLMMLFCSSSFGLMKILFGSDKISSRMSGTSGDFFSSVLYQTIGGIGTFVFLLLAVTGTAFLLIDGNVIKTLARLKLLAERIKEKFHREKEELAVQRDSKKKSLSDPEEEKDTFKEALKKEREKILKKKFMPSDSDEEKEENLIKETKINRPKMDDLESRKKDEKPVIDEISLNGSAKKKKSKEILSALSNLSPVEKINPSETDINPENSNEIEEIKGFSEEDFIEEKLENYIPPGIDLLDEPTKEEFEVISDTELSHNGRLLQEKLLKFGIEIEKVFATPGPVVTLYELVPAADVKLSKIESLQDDIALAMKAKGIRMIIPIPGKGTVGVEIPNSKAQMVRIRSIIGSKKYGATKHMLPIAFGKTIDGEVFVDDLAKMPHILIAGATGSGKSVGINNIIASLVFKIHPTDLKFVMVDPKKIELSLYSHLKKHFLATSPDINESIITTPSNAVSVLKSVEMEMERRYDKLANAGVRNIEAYNNKYQEGTLKNNEFIRHRKMPYIVVIIDELADLMITAKREIEEPIARIAQMARAVGIHMIVATQRPSVDVITGVIKANFPIRIAYQVASKIDSRTILDMSGAEQLLRNGDMLFLSSASPKPIRIQNAYVSTDECERFTDYISKQQGFTKPYLLPSIVEKKSFGIDNDIDKDELFEEAAHLIVKLGQCSTSTLQRRLKLGYARAARIVDQLEESGIVGPGNGAKGREILVSESELETIFYG